MSEYKISIYSSLLQHRLKMAFFVCCLGSIWLWPWRTLWQLPLQAALCLLLLWLLYQLRYQHKLVSELVLSEHGQVFLYQGVGESVAYKLAATSVTSDWFCYLLLLPDQLPGEKGSKIRLWVFRDGVDELSFRRIARVIHRLRRGSGSDSGV